MATRLRSFSKVNLGLRIGPVRPDGYHGLLTLYQTLALHDVVTVSARRLGPGQPTRISLESDHPRVPLDQRNTAWQMIERALTALGVTAEISISIDKRLPVQGGMGAGSANAATALVALERELGLWDEPVPALPQPRRLHFAAEVGSDVPLFLIGGAVLGTGRGEIVAAQPDLIRDTQASGQPSSQGFPCVVAVPKVGVSTPFAFREWDARHASTQELTSPAGQGTLSELSLVPSSASMLGDLAESGPSGIARDPKGFDSSVFYGTGLHGNLAENTLLALVRTGIENDFEEVVFPYHPSLRETKRLLMGEASGLPAIYAALSGSGSALFGLYPSEASAQAAQQRVQNAGTEAILTETLTREQYWSLMFADVG
ncbi:MAG: hypothetical protein NVSMB3_08470 [Acidobacteriaceae bacterium]